ncbi:NAD-P-binding protein [Cristinia sonorae]|uniref:NAD-P-binding protein n=1 Tax=Cristinia sonorae TaxID=1940300 RepID=A0A8K0XR87_9AGAR|nr:NAD-P-binding protein [Cristinia sonorae]
MPAVQAPAKVLVTGANGFVAVWVVKKLLEDGFAVRGTIRSEDKGVYLKETFASYGDKLELVVVKDITQDGAFDEAVKGVDAIQHTASPFHLNGTHPDDLIVPAVEGTRTILRSTLRHGTDVKRFIITSSCSAIEELLPDPQVYTEDDWNTQSVKEVEEKGVNASASHVYRASKTLAEREAWKFVEEHKNEIKWDLVAINPPYIFGPPLQEVASLDSLNMSMAAWYRYVVSGTADGEALATAGNNWVDVRDCAAGHVHCMTVQQAGGHRILSVAGAYKWQDWVNAARKIYPNLSVGNTTYDASQALHPIRYNTSKFETLLGLKYHTMEETSKAILESFEERGLWKPAGLVNA